ncbi:MAG: transporter [Prevotella sp.]|nr:transporter [Prevotella sp.]MBR6826541.1 transporter [Prevotella sp.]
MRGESIIRFIKDWTLPVAMTVGTLAYLVFYYVPQLDAAGDRLGPVLDVLMPVMVFLTLLITFCKVDFHQMRLHRWHLGVLAAQLLLVALNVGIIFYMEDDPQQKLLWEAVLTCIIGPSAAAAPVVVGKLGGNISTMTTYTLISAFLSALLIPVVFPLLEQTVHVDFLTALLIILEKVSMVLLLPLALGWLIQHYVEPLRRWVVSQPNLSFYSWAVSLSITTGITVKNIVHSQSSVLLLLLIAVATLVLCFVQFIIGRGIGRCLGETVNAGQALFQKNTGLSIWVAYMYLSPVASIGAGCYVLWQNIINSVEIWLHQRNKTTKCL